MMIISKRTYIGNCFVQCDCTEEILEFVRDTFITKADYVGKKLYTEKCEAYYFKCYTAAKNTVKDNNRWFIFDDKEKVRELANRILAWGSKKEACNSDSEILCSAQDTSIFHKDNKKKDIGYLYVEADDYFLEIMKFRNERDFKKTKHEKPTCTWSVVLGKAAATEFAQEILRILDISAAAQDT